jgi:3D (Asp-Asp-Asp) domain-containing protein
MSLQYLTNANPPPAESVLQYDVEPNNILVSTSDQQFYANLTITVYNPTSAPVNCMEFQFGFLAGATSGNLTTAAEAATIASVSEQNQWGIVNSGFVNNSNPHLYLFTATPSGIGNYLALAAGASLIFYLNDILIDQSVGAGIAPFTIIEETGTSNATKQTVQGTLDLTKAAGTISITAFNVEPPAPVAPGASIELSWTLNDSDHWQLYDSNTATLLYDSNTGTPPNLTEWPMPPQTLEPQQTTSYRLIAWAGQIYTAANTTAMVASPQVTATGPTAPVNALSEVTINWQTVNAQSIVIEPMGQTADATTEQGTFTVQPAEDTLYALTAMWTETSVSPPLVIKSPPANVQVYVNPPQILSFSVAPQRYTQGQRVSLSWETASTASASLSQMIAGDPTVIPLGNVDLSSNGYSVGPQDVSIYLLTATAQDETTSATITADGQNINIPDGSSQIVYDSANNLIWLIMGIGNSLVYRFNASDGSQVGEPIDVDNGPVALAFDGTYVWVACLIANSLTRILASDGTVQGNYIPVGKVPLALQYDSVNDLIWVINNRDKTLSRIRTGDGSSAGAPVKVGRQPIALTFDGINIWVVNAGDNTISLIRASDGTIVGSPIPSNSALSLTFDGNNVWAACFDQTVKKFDSQGNVLATYQAADTNPVDILFDGTNIWTANNSASTVSMLRAYDGTVFGSFPVGTNPYSLAFDGTYLWVISMDNGSNSVLLRFWVKPQSLAT